MLYFYNMLAMRRSARQELVFKALADYRRREILDMLKEEPRTTGELCGRFPNLDRCTVMQHIHVLEKADLIIIKREGRLRWNYLNAVPIREIYNRWIGEYASDAVELLTRMKSSIEGTK